MFRLPLPSSVGPAVAQEGPTLTQSATRLLDYSSDRAFTEERKRLRVCASQTAGPPWVFSEPVPPLPNVSNAKQARLLKTDDTPVACSLVRGIWVVIDEGKRPWSVVKAYHLL